MLKVLRRKLIKGPSRTLTMHAAEETARINEAYAFIQKQTEDGIPASHMFTLRSYAGVVRHAF
jgi:hypothetical protein